MDNREWGTYIRLCRERDGITQQELADYARVTVDTVRRWEKQGAPHSVIAFISILEVLEHAIKRTSGQNCTVDSSLVPIYFPLSPHDPKKDRWSDIRACRKTNGTPEDHGQ